MRKEMCDEMCGDKGEEKRDDKGEEKLDEKRRGKTSVCLSFSGHQHQVSSS